MKASIPAYAGCHGSPATVRPCHVYLYLWKHRPAPGTEKIADLLICCFQAAKQQQPPHLLSLLCPSRYARQSMVWGLQVTYPMDVASMVHLAPLVLMLLVLTIMTKGTGQTVSKLLPIARQAGLSAASFLCAVAIPAITGALRSALSGKSRYCLLVDCVQDCIQTFVHWQYKRALSAASFLCAVAAPAATGLLRSALSGTLAFCFHWIAHNRLCSERSLVTASFCNSCCLRSPLSGKSLYLLETQPHRPSPCCCPWQN